MTRNRVVAALLAVGGLAALSACSSWNTGSSSQTSSAAPAPAPMAAQELSPGMVKQVQTVLQQQNFYKGNIDGIWGPETQAAVSSYQQSKGMTANGQLTPATLSSLNLPSGGAAPMQPASASTQPAPTGAAPTTANAAAPMTTTTPATPPATSTTTSSTTPPATTTTQ
jgi:peptidoglycan hydrolase-like protein with peptidoglycan-binding domain